MSASSVAVPLQSKVNSGWLGRVFSIVELFIAGLWMVGSFRYLLQGGSYATVLLLFSTLLLAPRQLLTLAGLARAKAVAAPRPWVLLLALFLPEHLTSGGSVVMPHFIPLVLASGCLIADAFVAITTSADAWISLHRRAATILTGFVAVYAVVTTLLAILKLHAFGYIGQDIGYFMQCLYTGLHGALFSSNQYHDLLYTHTVTSDFAGHNQPVLFLLLPVYWAYPHAETLFIVRNLCMAASAYPAYQLARCRLQPFPALAVTIAFLLAPSVLFQNFYDYAPLSMVGLPLLFALLFYERRQFLPYMASLLLCLFIREDLALVTVALAGVALISRRSWKWFLVPAVAGISWAAFTWLYLLPHFQDGAVSAVESCFSYLGNSPSDMLRNMVAHPGWFITHKAVVYTKQLLTPFGMALPFFSPVSLASIPLYAINVLGDPGCNAAIVFRHYSLIPSVLLLPGVIVAMQAVTRHGNKALRTGAAALAIVLGSIGTTVLSIGETELRWWTPAPWNAEAMQVVEKIPTDAALAVPRYMLPFVANRERVYQSLRLLDYHHPNADYVVIDRDEERMGVTPTWEAHYHDLLERLQDRRQFEKVYSSTNYEVYQHIGGSLASLRPVVGSVGQ